VSFTTVRGQKIGFKSCECEKFLNIAIIHVFHIWEKRILSCNNTTFFLQLFNFFPFFDFAMERNFFPLRLRHQTSANNLRSVRSSAFCRQP